MGLGDLIYIGDAAIHVGIEIKSDGVPWLDVNAATPEADVDYFQALLRWPTVTVQTEEDGGLATCQTDVLVLDNAPRYALSGTTVVPGADYGFWDLPLPLTIRGLTFDSWAGRRLRVVLKTIGPDGLEVASNTLATLRIDEVRRSGNEARIKLVGLQAALIGCPVDDLKGGTEWYRSLPIGALMKMILKKKAPDIAVDPALDSGVDYGTLPGYRASSWGSMPGPAASGYPPSAQYVARCMAVDPTDGDHLWVGFECFGANSTSGGAIGRLDVSTGRWLMVQLPTAGGPMESKFPVQIYVTSTHVWAMVYREWQPMGFGAIWSLELYNVTKSGGSPHIVGSATPYWPCRETIRKGFFQSGVQYFGIRLQAGNWVWAGEPVMVPFPQALSPMFPFVDDRYLPTVIEDRSLFKHYQTRADLVDTATGAPGDASWQYPIYAPSATGHWSGFCAGTQNLGTPYFAALRYFMTTHRTPPIILRDGTNDYFTWIALNPDKNLLRFDIYQKKIVDPEETITYRTLANLGNATRQLYDRQVSAFCLWPGTNGVRKFLVAETEWLDDLGFDTSVRWVKTRLVGVDATGASGSDATLTAVWDYTPSGANAYQEAPQIVHLWTPKALTGGVGQTKGWSVAVICNRGDVSGPCYGLGIIRGAGISTPAWLVRWPSYNYGAGPVSSREFAGFVEDPALEQAVHFVDQATGQAWTIFVDNLGSWGVTFSQDNDGRPIDDREPSLSAPLGAVMGNPSDGYDRIFWAMAPGVPGDLQVPWHQQTGWQSADLRRQPGVFGLTMFSQKVADAVPVADMGVPKDAWEALRMLAKRAPGYQMLIDGSGTFRFVPRDTATPTYTLRPVLTAGVVEIEGNQIGYGDGGDRYQASREIQNAIDIVPWGPVPGEAPAPEVLLSGGSTWAGRFLVDVSKVVRSMRVRISCAAGGDIELTPGFGSWGLLGLLFRYERLPEKSHIMLQATAGSASTTIYVSGLTLRGGRCYSGEQEIRAGDRLRVLDGTTTAIQAILPHTIEAVRLDVSPSIGVAAGAWSDVLIEPRAGSQASDDPAGLTKVGTGGITSGATALPLVDTAGIRPGMVLRIQATGGTTGAEFLRVVNVGRTTVDVVRGVLGSAATAHAAGDPVMGYLCIWNAGDLYQVGDTGILFGIEAPSDDVDAGGRTISPGDGVAVRTLGMRQAPIDHAMIRVQDSGSIAEHGRREAPKVDGNPFVDALTGQLLGESVITYGADARMILEGIEAPLVPGLDITQAVNVQDRRVVPDGTSKAFSIRGIVYRLAARVMNLTLRSQAPIDGAGRVAGPSVGGFAMGAGKKGDIGS